MDRQTTAWSCHIRLNARGYLALLVIGLAALVAGELCRLGSGPQYALYAVVTGIGSFVLIHVVVPQDVPWTRQLVRNWKWYSSLVAGVVLFWVVGGMGKSGSDAQQFLEAVAAGIFGLLLFQTVTDFRNAKFVEQILDEHEVSYHVGARLYGSHREVMLRADALEKYVRNGDPIRLLTSTADDYVLPDRDAYEVVCRKLDCESSIQILLFTPVYNLLSFLDTRTRPGHMAELAEEGDGGHGQHHRRTRDLVAFQYNEIIPAIEKLISLFPSREVKVRFFYIRHHVNMAIYGERRIFSAPILLGTKGRALPCIEVFPGLTGDELFQKMEMEFKYIWGKRNLWFTLDEMKEIYGRIARDISDYLSGLPVKGIEEARKKYGPQIDLVEAYAEEMLRHRNEYLNKLEAKGAKTKDEEIERLALDALNEFRSARPSAQSPPPTQGPTSATEDGGGPAQDPPPQA